MAEDSCTSQSPEQVRVGDVVSHFEPTIRSHYLELQKLIGSEAVSTRERPMPSSLSLPLSVSTYGAEGMIGPYISSSYRN